MTLGTATIFAALVLAPGLVMLMSAAATMRVQRDLGNAAMTLILGAALAVLAHLAAGLLGWIAWSVADSPILSGLSTRGIDRILLAMERVLAGKPVGVSEIFNLMIYSVFAVAVAGVLGRVFGWLVVQHRIDLPIFHGAFYRYTRSDDDVVLYASVLTKTQVDGKTLLYVGLVEEITRVRGAQCDAIALKAPFKALMSADAEAGLLPDENTVRYLGDENADPDTAVYINASEIANIVLFTQRVQF